MKREGVAPDIITYNSLLKCAGAAGLFDQAQRLYSQLRREGLRTTTFTYASLFNAAARVRHGDASWLLQVCAWRWALHRPLSWAMHSAGCASTLDFPAGFVCVLATTQPGKAAAWRLGLCLHPAPGAAGAALAVWRQHPASSVPACLPGCVLAGV